MIILLLPVFCFTLIAMGIAVLMKRTLNRTFLLSAALIIMILYVFGLMNFSGGLLLGYILIVLLSLVSMIYLLFMFRKKPQLFVKRKIALGLGIFVLFFIFSLFLNYDRMFILWDEFSFWGSVLKHMYVFDAFGTYEKSFLFIKSYFPGIPVFNYFWVRPFQTFQEYPAYLGINVIFFSSIILFVEKVNWRNVLFILLACLIPLLMGVNFFNSLYVDCLLGILFACVLLYHLKYGYGKSLFNTITILALIFIISVTKDIGVVFSFIAIFVILMDTILFSRKKSLQKSKDLKFFPKISKIGLFLLPVIICFFGYMSWRIHVRITGNNGELIINTVEQTDIREWNLTDCQKNTIESFRKAVFINGKGLYPLTKVSVFKIILLYAAFTVLCIFTLSHPQNRLREIFFFSTAILGFVGYLLVLLLSYLFVFSCYEAIRLNSYERYVFSYFIAMIFLLLYFLIADFKIKKITSTRQISILLLAFSFIFALGSETGDSFKSQILNARSSVNYSLEYRSKYKNAIKWKEYINNEGERTYIATLHWNKGLDKLILMHTLYPSNLEWVGDSIVNIEPYYPEWDVDPWTIIMTPVEWSQYISENYTLVYIFEYPEPFGDNYGIFFDELEEDMLYRVDTDSEGTLELNRVETKVR